MKLPTDKKERMKWLAMIFIGSVVIVIVAIYYGIIPLLQKRSQMKVEISDLKEKLEKAKKRTVGKRALWRLTARRSRKSRTSPTTT